jgi:AbrB family looped-hinge helix DNA binding protein
MSKKTKVAKKPKRAAKAKSAEIIEREYWCTPTESMSCCMMEGVVSVDERGQITLPKEIREKANIQTGDKLAVISWEEGKNFTISLLKAENLTKSVSRMDLGYCLVEVKPKTR